MCATPTAFREMLEEARSAIFSNQPQPETEETFEGMSSSDVYTFAWKLGTETILCARVERWKEDPFWNWKVAIRPRGKMAETIREQIRPFKQRLVSETHGTYEFREMYTL